MDHMRRKALLVFAWFPLTIVLLVLNLTVLGSLSRKIGEQTRAEARVMESETGLALTSGTGQVLGAQVIPGDARALLLESFLASHDSPMAPFAGYLVEQADLNNIDWRLVTAIAMCESNLGKRLPKTDAYNAWGIAVYTNQLTGKYFSDWYHAISWVSRYLRQNYYDKGITSLRDIGAIWAPPSVEKGYSWTNCVQSFMDQIQ